MGFTGSHTVEDTSHSSVFIGLDGFQPPRRYTGNQNRNQDKIKELSGHIAALTDKVQYMLLKRKVATLVKKVQRLLPLDEGRDNFKTLVICLVLVQVQMYLTTNGSTPFRTNIPSRMGASSKWV